MATKTVVKKTKKKYVIIRADRAGCFAGTLESSKQEGATKTVVLSNARRLWYWDGAASLSQLAQSGTSKPQNCKFPEPVSRIEVMGVIEILDVSPAAEASIKKVDIWQA